VQAVLVKSIQIMNAAAHRIVKNSFLSMLCCQRLRRFQIGLELILKLVGGLFGQYVSIGHGTPAAGSG
jgi:hypothetical protein